MTSLSVAILTQAVPNAEKGISQTDREMENKGLGQEEKMSRTRLCLALRGSGSGLGAPANIRQTAASSKVCKSSVDTPFTECHERVSKGLEVLTVITTSSRA